MPNIAAPHTPSHASAPIRLAEPTNEIVGLDVLPPVGAIPDIPPPVGKIWPDEYTVPPRLVAVPMKVPL